MSSLKTVTKNTFLYTISSVLQRASSIIFFPIFSYYLTKGDYGIQSVIGYLSTFITLAAGLELTRTATRLIYDQDEKEERIKEVYGAYAFTIFVSNVVIGILLLLVGPYFLKPFLNDIKFSPYMTFTIFTLPFVAMYSLFKNYLQATHKGVLFIKVDMVYFLLNISFNLYFVIVYKMGAAGIILSTVVSSILINIYTYFAFFRKTRLRFNWKVVKEGLHLSMPLIPFILLGSLTDNTDKAALNTKMGKDVSGIYYISIMLASLFNVFRESCNQALNPWFFGEYKNLDKNYVNKVIYTVFAGMAIVAIGISWFSYEILIVLSRNKDLIVAYKYVPIIANTALVVFLSQIYYMCVFYYKKLTRYLFLTTLIAWPVNVLLCLFLIKFMGPYGAALSNFGAMTALTIVCGILSYRSGFKINDIYFVVVIVIAFVLSLGALLPLEFWTLLALKIAGILILSAGYYLYLNKHFNVKEIVLARINKIPFFRRSAEV